MNLTREIPAMPNLSAAPHQDRSASSKAVTDAGGQRSAALFERARKVMPSGYTRQMAVTHPHPAYVARGEGCWVTDVDGNRRIDWVNNFASLMHGHNKREIVEAIHAQAATVMLAVMPSEWEVKLAELLCERIPSVEQVRFMNSGTEANLMAVKTVRAYTGKHRIAKMEGGYHGQYDLLENSFQPKPDRWGDPKAPTAVAYSAGTPQSLLDELVILPLNDIEASRALLRRHAHELAAVILDPLRLQLGVVAPRRDYLEMLREETQKLGIVLIFDEVLCLRVGYHGAQGLHGITPDLTTMGKIIGGGLPVGALGGRAEFMSVFAIESGEPKIKHSGTFTANAMTMAAGTTSMALMTPAAFDRLDAVNQRLRDGLERIRVDLKIAGVVQGAGSLSSLLMTDLPLNNYRELLFAMASGLAVRIETYNRLLLEEGVYSMRGGFIGSTPMTEDDIDFTLAAVRRALTRMQAL
jgi:glutamate-1-semialdehyde 2,1-aminomutase